MVLNRDSLYTVCRFTSTDRSRQYLTNVLVKSIKEDSFNGFLLCATDGHKLIEHRVEFTDFNKDLLQVKPDDIPVEGICLSLNDIKLTKQDRLILVWDDANIIGHIYDKYDQLKATYPVTKNDVSNFPNINQVKPAADANYVEVRLDAKKIMDMFGSISRNPVAIKIKINTDNLDGPVVFETHIGDSPDTYCLLMPMSG